MRLAGLFDDALGGILGSGKTFGMAQSIAEDPTKSFGIVGRQFLDSGNAFGAVGSVTNQKAPLNESMGLMGWDDFG